jgi:hypothetical protein
MTPIPMRFASIVFAVAGVLSFAGAHAASSVEPRASDARNDPLNAGEPASAAMLDAMRGGFEAAGGLQVSFGIERSIYINGALVTTTSLNVADSGQVTAIPGSSIALMQSGANNNFQSGPSATTNAATVIQNSLDNQKIQGVTVINATVNSLSLTKSANIQSSIQDALTGSLRR